MKTVYIASPYSIGDQADNVRRSLKAADTLLACGYIPFVPLLSHFWHLYSPKAPDVWYKYDNEWVTRCDCLLRLPGESVGADNEVKLAFDNDIPIYYTIGALVKKEAV